MTFFLLRIGAAFLLSTSSLLLVLFRVSPITSPAMAISSFFITVFLTIATGSSLLFYGLWHTLRIEGMDLGTKMHIALREALFLALALCLLIALSMLSIMTWWIAILILLLFLLIEIALQY